MPKLLEVVAVTVLLVEQGFLELLHKEQELLEVTAWH
jgi:hypothetical protein